MSYKLIILPPNMRFILLGIILLIWLGSRALIFLKQSKTYIEPGSPRDYGMGGGAICPKCHRPFQLALFELKFGLGTKIVRCPFCGKVSLVRRASLDELRAAEAAELADAQPTPVQEKSEAEKLQDLIEQSRFTDRS